MRLVMNDEQIQTIEQVKEFLEGSEALEFRGLCVEEKYKLDRDSAGEVQL